MSESSYHTQVFTCTGFAEALSQATEETIGDVKAAIRSATKKMVRNVRTLVSDEIRVKYNVPRSILNERLEVFAGRLQDMETELVIGGKSIPLSYFGMQAAQGHMRKTVTIKKTDRGYRGKLKTTMKRSSVASTITVEVIKGRRTTLKKSAFVAVMKSGHIGIMHRGPGVIKSRSESKGAKHKQALHQNSVVSIASMFTQVGVNAAVVAKIDAELEALFWHELGFYLERSATK